MKTAPHPARKCNTGSAALRKLQKQDFRTDGLARRNDEDSTLVRQGGATPPAQWCEKEQDSRTAGLARRNDEDSTLVRQGGATPPAQWCESPEKIALIGGGNMAAALIGGWLKHGASPTDLLAFDPDNTARDALRAQFGIHVGSTADASLASYQVIVLAVKPQQLKIAAQQAAPHVQHALIISLAAGIRLAEIARWLGGHRRIVRAMPNTPALIGKGITGLIALPSVEAADRSRATQLLEAVGDVVLCQEEHAIDAIAAISGSGPAYLFYFIEALERAARALGFDPAQSHTLAVATVQGAAQLAAQSEQPIGALRERVTSKGGTTAAALASFEHDHLADAILRGVQAARARAQEIGDGFQDDPF